MTDRELMQMALDAMRAVSVDEHLCNAAHHVKKDRHGIDEPCPIAKRFNDIAEALRARLAQPEPEPVFAFRRKGLDDFCTCSEDRYNELAQKPNLFEVKKFYTAPPQREWQTLTENEIKHLWYEACQTNLELTSQLIVHLARNIEDKLKEMNA